MNHSGDAKKTAVSREIVPADGSNPAQRGDLGTSPLEKGQPSDDAEAYLALIGVAMSKRRCPFQRL
jgi:hypothetical protein